MAYDSQRGVTVMFGGEDAGGWAEGLWEYDGSTWTLRADTPGPWPRVDSGMAYDSARGVTVLFGGLSMDGRKNDTWE